MTSPWYQPNPNGPAPSDFKFADLLLEYWSQYETLPVNVVHNHLSPWYLFRLTWIINQRTKPLNFTDEDIYTLHPDEMDYLRQKHLERKSKGFNVVSDYQLIQSPIIPLSEQKIEVVYKTSKVTSTFLLEIPYRLTPAELEYRSEAMEEFYSKGVDK